MSTKLVRDVMHRGVIICWIDELLTDVARRLCEYEINALSLKPIWPGPTCRGIGNSIAPKKLWNQM